MSFETDLITKYESVFGGRLWFDQIPDGTPRSQLSAPFGIMQQVGGKDQWYFDNTLPDYQNARMQFWVWGDRRIAVADAARTLRKAIADSNTSTFITMPQGAAVGDYNEVLKLAGARQTFGFWYTDPLANP